MCFRVAVREAEAWLLADRDSLGNYLGVSPEIIPRNPENLFDAKQALVNVARRSRRRAIREDMVPREGSGRQVGAAYASRVIEFVTASWEPGAAAAAAPSLRRCLDALTQMVARSYP